MTLEEKLSVLEAISSIAPENASAEDEENLFSYFLPLRSYSKLADPKVFLVTGGRGAGKSELFRMLTSKGGLEHVLGEADRRRYTKLKKARFLVGYQSSGKGSRYFPTKFVCDHYAKGQDEGQVTCFWAGLLCAVLLRDFAGDEEVAAAAEQFLGKEQAEYLCQYSSMPEKWLVWMAFHQESWEAFLDRCDQYFEQIGEQIYITYDELDRICQEYGNLFLFCRSLLNFWFTHNNRWQNLKTKIFLRSDLYNAKALRFIDSSKMRAYRLELQWDSLSLYRLLVKRLANCGNPFLLDYLKSIPDLLLKKEEVLGYLPGSQDISFQELVEKMIGRYMGRTPKKGYSYTWVPNHIQDANGELSPRPFLKCFVFAAMEQRGHEMEVEALEEERLLHSSRLQAALSEVSKDRVKELVEEEYGWLEILRKKLIGQSMLMNRAEFLGYLLPENWSQEERAALPGRTPEELLDVLKILGIFFETEDGRINTPEIYLHGFGLKRRGGIKRPRKY